MQFSRMSNLNFNKPQLTKAFQHVNLLSDNQEQSEGQIQKQDFGIKRINKIKKSFSSSQKDNNNLMINMQALHTKEVDHNIQQVGLVAVRQVKYISEKQWLKLVKRREKQYQLLDKIRNNHNKNQIKQQTALKRKRNQKGQFITSQSKKNKPIQKQKSNRGRKPKNYNQFKQVQNKQSILE